MKNKPLYIEVPVQSHGKWAVMYLCVRGIDFDTFATVWYFVFVFRVTQSLLFCVLFCRPLVALLLWPLYCLSFRNACTKSGPLRFPSFPVVDWFCLFIDLWVLTFPLEDCSVFGNFVITLIQRITAFVYPFGMSKLTLILLISTFIDI